MKKFFRMLFFWNNGAEGAVFAATWWMVISYLLSIVAELTVLQGQNVQEVLMFPAFYLGLLFLFSIYPAILFCRALFLFIKNSIKNRSFRAPLEFFAAALLLLPGIGLAIFHYKLAVLVFFSLNSSAAIDIFLFRELGENPLGRLLFVIPPQFWWSVVAGSLGILLAGYFLMAKSFADSEKRKFSSVFGKASLALWGIAIALYLVFSGLAFWANGKMERTKSAVTAHSAEPLTMAQLETHYRPNGNQAFWEKLSSACETLRKAPLGRAFRPGDINPELEAAYSKLNQDALAVIHSCFDTTPPAYPMAWRTGSEPAPSYLQLDFQNVRELFQFEMLYALKQNDKAAALQAWQRHRNCYIFYKLDPYKLDYFTRTGIGMTQCDMLAILLAYDVLTQNEIQTFAADFAAMDAEIPQAQESAFFAEKVLTLAWAEDVWKENEYGKVLAPYGWLFPHMLMHFRLDMEAILAATMAEDSSGQEKNVPQFLIARFALHRRREAIFNFMDFSAKCRTIQVLCRAAIYKLEHGKYPESMSDLPIDPYSGKSLCYFAGEIEETDFSKIEELPDMPPMPGNMGALDLTTPPDWNADLPKVRVPAVSSWSVGRYHIEGGIESELRPSK